MFLIISAFVFICTGVCDGQYRQKLVCPYSQDQRGLQRVWCRRDDGDQKCCTGFTFNSGAEDLEAGRLTVQDDGRVFVVSVNSLSQGDGVYWCGLRNNSNTIIKLAETQLYTTPPGFIWEILRWVVFCLLLTAVISTSIYSKKKSGK